MWKSVKDARRRVVESVMSNVGASERTTDPEYIKHSKYFDEMVEDMNEIGACMSEMLRSQKVCFNEVRNLATCLAKVYVRNEDIDDWPDCENKMGELAGAIAFSEETDYIHNTIRSSSGMATVETTLEPLRAAVTKMCPEVSGILALRTEAMADLDAHRRRLRTLEEKIKAVPAKADALEGDLNKFRSKFQNSEYKFKQSDVKAKHEILLAKLAHDKLVDMLLITTVVCQQELYKRAAANLTDVISHFPKDKVSKVRDRVQRLIDQGGVHKTKKNVGDKSRVKRVVAVATGKMGASDAMNTKEKLANKEHDDDKEAARIRRMVKKMERESYDDVSGSHAKAQMGLQLPQGGPMAAPPPPPPQTQAPVKVLAIVRALWDNPARDQEELSLVAGEIVEVLEKPQGDDDWWRGRDKHGNVGLFPTNYVEPC
jgi:hypothetical protein